MTHDPYLDLNRDLNELVSVTREFEQKIQEAINSSNTKPRSVLSVEDFLDELKFAS